jgi:hypothetical protein
MINFIFKNNKMIGILAIKLSNTILLLVCLKIKFLLTELMVRLDNFSALLGVPRVEKEWKTLRYILGIVEGRLAMSAMTAMSTLAVISDKAL